MAYRIICDKAEKPKGRDKIQCTVLKQMCVYQRYRTCKDQYWQTDGAIGCKARKDDWKNGRQE